MVTTNESTNIVTQPKIRDQTSPSLKRWFKHTFYLSNTKRFFSKQDQHAIAQAVQQAEQGHVGEIQVILEGCLPANVAYHQDTLIRARQLFAALGIWDTEYNSGVLLYLNLCERKVEIVIDRGIKQATDQAVWDEICQSILSDLKLQQHRLALIQGVQQIGTILETFYQGKYQDEKDELDNQPIIL